MAYNNLVLDIRVRYKLAQKDILDAKKKNIWGWEIGKPPTITSYSRKGTFCESHSI